MCSTRHLTKNSLPHHELLTPPPRASPSTVHRCGTRAPSQQFSKHTCSLPKSGSQQRGKLGEGRGGPSLMLCLSPGESASLGTLSLPRLENALIPATPIFFRTHLELALLRNSLSFTTPVSCLSEQFFILKFCVQITRWVFSLLSEPWLT